jgi:hypothetical protein
VQQGQSLWFHGIEHFKSQESVTKNRQLLNHAGKLDIDGRSERSRAIKADTPRRTFSSQLRLLLWSYKQSKSKSVF